jgi:hypothetical protein
VLKSQVGAILVQDVEWPGVVDDVSAKMPANVWLTTFQGQHTLAPAPAVGAATKTTAAAPTSTGGAVSTAKTGANNASAATNELAANAAATGAGETPATGAPSTPLSPNGAPPCSMIGPATGTVTMTGIAKDFPTLASFLDALKDVKSVQTVWLTSAQKSKFGTTDMLTFQITAALDKGARGHRLEEFFKEPSCK